jgi:hypothetical protein
MTILLRRKPAPVYTVDAPTGSMGAAGAGLAADMIKCPIAAEKAVFLMGSFVALAG